MCIKKKSNKKKEAKNKACVLSLRPGKFTSEYKNQNLTFTNHQEFSNQSVQKLLKNGTLQPKLRLNNPNDPYEREADRVADQIMSDAKSTKFKEYITPVKISRKPNSTTGEASVPSYLENQINSLKGKGQPLDRSTRDFFEPYFGDLGSVRIHTDNNSEKLADEINAKAFTSGNNIVFSVGQYSPKTYNGKKLLAHELVHKIKQKANNFHNPSFVHRKKKVQTDAKNFKEWWSGVRNKYFVLKQKAIEERYKIELFVFNEGKWQKIANVMEVWHLPINRFKWKINPPNGDPFWAISQTILNKLDRISIKKSKKMLQKDKIHIKFFSDPKYEGVCLGNAILRTDTNEGIQWYKNVTKGKSFEVGVPASPYWQGYPVYVTMNPMLDFGNFIVVGEYDYEVLVMFKQGGRLVIYGYSHKEFYKYIKLKIAQSLPNLRIIARLVEIATKKVPLE